MNGLQKISGCDRPDRVADVVFVHGLDGDARTTWYPKDHPEAFWPAWLGEDVPAVGVWSLGYAVSASAWKGHTMPLADRATNILDLLDLDGIGRRPVVFICHSLGGLLVKQLLRHAGDFGNPAWKGIATQTKAIVFLSTPHSGADLASWIQYIGGLLRTTVSVEELEAHHPRLRELNTWYRGQVGSLGIKTVVYCEKRPVAGILVVNETTADPGIAGVIPIPVDEDHVSMCKPASKDSQIYRRVKRLVEEVVTGLSPAPDSSAGSNLGPVKIKLCERLGSDWPLLADYFEIPAADRARVDNSQYRLLKATTPGPYTFILEGTKELPRRVLHPKRKTIGLRVPEHAVVSALLAELDGPMLSSTLILPGEDLPMTDAEEIRDRLGKLVDLVIEAGYCGPEATTVIDLTSGSPELIRAGRGPLEPFGL